MRAVTLGLFLLLSIISNAQSPSVPVDQYIKLSPGALLYLKHSADHFLFPHNIEGKIPALVQLKNEAWEEKNNYETNSQSGRIISMQLFPTDLIHLLADDNVEYIDIAWRLNRLHPTNDTTRILSHVDEVHSGLSHGLSDNYLGTGVIVGIVDIGFQPDNPTFYSADGSNTRIKRWWNQSDTKGQKPAGFNYGTEYSAIADILSAVDDDGTHGTHVGGIAAGSGFSTPSLKYRGMAPDADLAFVTIKYSNDSLKASALGDYVVANTTVLDGFSYLFQYGALVKKPVVANLSWGLQTGPHDGTSLFDKALESMVGKGKVLCGSAGNDAGHGMHVSGNLNSDTLYTFAIDNSRKNYVHESIYVDCWGAAGKPFGLNVSLFDTLGNLLIQSPFHYGNSGAIYKKVFTNGIDTMWLTITANSSFVNNGKPEILLMAESNRPEVQWMRLGFTGEGIFHAWNSGRADAWTSGKFSNEVKGNNHSGEYLNGSVQYSIIENGGTGKAMITVGSYVARKDWTDFNGTYRANNWLKIGEVSGFSSRGPSVDNRIKPDIISPGQLIASSINYRTYSGWMSEVTPLKTTFAGKDQYWTLFSGTSMAAPHVTGIIALMLQVKPDLSPDEVRLILQSTAQRDSFTGLDSNVNSGYGKVNALAAIKKLIQLQMHEPGVKNHFLVYPNPASNQTTLLFPSASGMNGSIELYDITGKMAIALPCNFDNMGAFVFSTENLAQGMYQVCVQLANRKGSAQLVIRR